MNFILKYTKRNRPLSNQKGVDYTYTFFVQPQINYKNNSIFGYEVLLRKQDDEGNWNVPSDFTELPIKEQTALVEKTSSILQTATKDKVLAFNLNNEQANDPLTIGAIITLKKRIDPASLTIELTEAPTLPEIKEISMMLHQYDIDLVLDDVGTGSNTYKNVRNLLPYVDQIKFAMQNLRMSGEAEKIPECLSFWVSQAKKYCLNLILEGVEDNSDQNLAEKFGINIQQGYLYGKPSLV
ncbi:EAL domain-containing protein [Companilactobacillus baiquanensis]|uniref:EAL domain-containing protein n=1 Tax=Companilactobacillus baiquanensis TaxID=2486005 RepID=A0ABW1UXL0_9LACO|nr:EAL domain-containing protein [Companilactobacillus baiquanensis]